MKTRQKHARDKARPGEHGHGPSAAKHPEHVPRRKRPVMSLTDARRAPQGDDRLLQEKLMQEPERWDGLS